MNGRGSWPFLLCILTNASPKVLYIALACVPMRLPVRLRVCLPTPAAQLALFLPASGRQDTRDRGLKRVERAAAT